MSEQNIRLINFQDENLRKENKSSAEEKLASKFNAPKKNTSFDANFYESLEVFFNGEVAHWVLDIFKMMGIPAPQHSREFLKAKEGILAFSNELGLIFRMERTNFKLDAVRITDSPNVARSIIASIPLGFATFEIHAGRPPIRTKEEQQHVIKQLAEEGVEYWDHKFSNTAYGPIPTDEHPKGEPMVIDTGACRRLTENVDPVRVALARKANQEKLKAQDEFYAPLRAAFEAGRKDPAKMKDFKKLCEKFVEQGKLVAGWNMPRSPEAMMEVPEYGDNNKHFMAATAAGHYGMRLTAAKRAAASSAAQAVPQSRIQPA